MAFWSTPGIDLDPKRNFRFLVKFSAVANKTLKPAEFLAQQATRPVPTISGETKVEWLDKSYYYPGKVKWNDVQLTFIDGVDTGENMAKGVYNYLYNEIKFGAYNLQDDHRTISKANAIFTGITIEALKTDGKVAETYILNNPFITTTELSGFDYTNEGVATVKITLKYDWAEVK